MWFKLHNKSDAERHVTYRFDHTDGRCVASAFGFETNSAVLHPNQHILLRHFAKNYDANTYLEVFGRADRSGSDAHNLRLSQARAREVRKALVGFGVPAGALFGFYCRALGEWFDASRGVVDGTRTQGGRTVWLFSWPSQRAYTDALGSNFWDLITFGRTRGIAA